MKSPTVAVRPRALHDCFPAFDPLEARLLLSLPPQALPPASWASPSVSDMSEIRIWDGEAADSTSPPGYLLNTFGGNPVQGIAATVSCTTEVVHSGQRAYEIKTNGTIPVGGFDFVATALAGFGPTTDYVDTRDISSFQQVEFWVQNATGSPFDLTFEIKDYRDSNDQCARRTYAIDAAAPGVWTQVVVPLDLSTGWNVIGQPDLTRARQFALVIHADRGAPVNGSVFIDDMDMTEKGGPVDPATAPLTLLVERLAQWQFDGLWGSRDRDSGFLPAISAYADVLALNTTAALVKMLPRAVDCGWVTRSEADGCVRQIVAALDRMRDQTTYLPPRYVDRVSLAPTYVQEESLVDAAMMYLALYQYQADAQTVDDLRTAINAQLSRFGLAAFKSAAGWKMAYQIPEGQFTTNTYDGYSGEIWTISLASDLAGQVPITELYNSGINRVRTYLVDPDRSHVVLTDSQYRAPFLQWLFDLFVDTQGRGTDTYPEASLATNPHDNAVLYQQEADAELAALGRATMLQPDAGDDGTGGNYQQFSVYNDFGQGDLYMPWSVAFSLLADPAAAEAALRQDLEWGLHGPLGLTDSVKWPTGADQPDSFTSRCDFWNLSLSTMAFLQYLYDDSYRLSSVPEVDAALDKVFTGSPDMPTISIGDAKALEGSPCINGVPVIFPIGGPMMTFNVTLSHPSTQTVTVDYATSSGTAVPGEDYDATSGVLAFAPGETSKTINVRFIPDMTPEMSETFFVDLAAPVNAAIADSRGEGTILNDDVPTAGVLALEVERGSGGGRLMQRSHASGARTRWLGQGQSVTLTWTQKGDALYELVPVYSNDGPADKIQISLDGKVVGEFATTDTRAPGAAPGTGWNQFYMVGAGNVTLAQGPHQLTLTVLAADSYGVELDQIGFAPLLAGGPSVVKVMDSQNTVITVKLMGPGVADATYAEDGSGISRLSVNGTTAKSSLTITTSGGNNRAEIGSITVTGSLGRITAGTSDLLGDLSVSGSLGTLSLRSISGPGQHAVTVAGAGVTPGKAALGSVTVAGDVSNSHWDVGGIAGNVTINGTVSGWDWGADAGSLVTTAAGTLRLGDVTSASVVIGGPISSIRAKRWQAGSVTADSLTTLSTPGAAKTATAAAIPGDYLADLTLTGAGLAPTASTLGTATVKGNVASSTWDVTGKVGAVTISGAIGAAGWPWELKNAASVGSLTLGDVTNAVVTATGDVGAVKAICWLDGSIQAARVASITTSGVVGTPKKPAVSGDFGADVTLSFTGTKSALASLTVAGWLTGATISSAGAVGTVSLGGIRDSTLSAGDLAGAYRKITGLTVKGLKTAPTASFVNSKISAWTLGTVSVKGVQTVNGQAAFGIKGHTIASYTRDGRRFSIPKNPALPLVVDQADDYAVQLA